MAATRAANPRRNKFSAFTVAELGEMLSEGLQGSWKMAKGEWRYEYEPLEDDGEGHNVFQEGETEANARANMLICLLENRLLTPQSLAAEED